MSEKISEKITEISGINTKPFHRYVNKIPLNDFINTLKNEKIKSNHNGYNNLSLMIKENRGIIDISLYGDRDLNEEEKKINERIDVIFRKKEKTSKGLTRDELL